MSHGKPQRYAPWTSNHERLWVEIRKKNARKVRMFVSANPECVGWVDSHGKSALHESVCLGDEETAEVLMSNGADVNLVVSSGPDAGLSPLHLSVLCGSIGLIEMLLVRGGDPDNARPSDGFTPLHLAATSSVALSPVVTRQLVKLFAEKDADLDAENSAGESALVIALRLGKIDLAKELIAHGADTEKATSSGLHLP